MNVFPPKLWTYAATMCAAAGLCAALLAAHGDNPRLAPLLILGGFAVYCANRVVLLPNGTGVSPGFMISMTAIVVFRAQGSLAGPVLVAAASGVSVRGLSRKTWGWLPFNSGLTALGVLGAAAAFRAVPSGLTVHMPAAFFAALVPALVYSVIGWVLVVLSYAVEQRHVPREVMSSAGSVLVQVLPFGLVGFFLGRLYISLGPAVMLLIIVPILIAREMFASYMRVKESHDETVQLLIRALEQKDPYTAGHAGRVAVYAGYVGEELEFMPARMERLRFAALMHDIGKLVVPNQLLNKPGKLTEDEFARVRIHEGVSVQMLSHIDFLRPIAMHAHSDTMKFDPDDPNHPIEPYIIMVADAYDAMTSTRSYRKALPQEVAFQELRDKAGKQFHPACAEALIRAIEKRNEVHGKGHEEVSHFEHAPEVGLGSAGLGDLLSDDKAGAADEKASQ